MRDIKFRCWNMHGKCMHQWDELVEKNKIHLLANQKGSYPIMQYTGLKDKNGVEVYEGDICLVVTNGSCYKDTEMRVIVFNNGRFNVGSGSIDASCKFEVIGNIHQNPELING